MNNALRLLKLVIVSFVVTIGVITIIGCPPGGGGDDDDDDDNNTVTLNDYVGSWTGIVNLTATDEFGAAYTIVNVNEDGSGSLAFIDDDTDLLVISSISVVNETLQFDIPNVDPDEPDCQDWDVSATLSLDGTFSASGVICDDDGGQPGTFSGTLSWSDGSGMDEISLDDFVGTWTGTFTLNIDDFTDTPDGVFTINADGSASLVAEGYEEDTWTIPSSSINFGVITFSVPNIHPGNPECENWDMFAVLTKDGLFCASGTFCFEGGGEPGTLTATLTLSE